MADRFFAPDLVPGVSIRLTGDEARHLSRVARREVGDTVEVFDGRGECISAVVETIDRDGVVLSPRGAIADRGATVELTLCVAPPKGDRLDWLIEKATELGVARFVPVKSERSVVDPRSAKLDRLRRAVIEASKQCGRSRLMLIEEPKRATEMLKGHRTETRLFADMGGSPPALWPTIDRGSRVALAVGPEGGWSEAERRSAIEDGWTLVALGPTRLRVETAALVGSAIVLSRVLENAP